eukprot:5325517-Amphidinium_carterae.1
MFAIDRRQDAFHMCLSCFAAIYDTTLSTHRVAPFSISMSPASRPQAISHCLGQGSEGILAHVPVLELGEANHAVHRVIVALDAPAEVRSKVRPEPVNRLGTSLHLDNITVRECYLLDLGEYWLHPHTVNALQLMYD